MPRRQRTVIESLRNNKSGLNFQGVTMYRKSIIALLGLGALLLGSNVNAALTEPEKGFVDQLANGGWLAIRRTAETLVRSGNSNTEVLDVAAEVLLEKYPRAGEDADPVDAMSWVCKALGQSGNSRYRPI